MRDRSLKGYRYFVWLNPSNASWGFTGYTDKEGVHQYIKRGVDDRGNILYRRFKFTPSRRIISIPETQADVIEFLLNHPECEGSVNGYYRTDEFGKNIQVGVVFKEMNTGKDAQIAIDAIAEKQSATGVALSYKKAIEENDPEGLQELEELAVLCGSFNEDPRLQLHSILQYAENSPKPFMEIYNDPARKARFLLNKGLHGANPFIKKRGFMLYWQDIHLGNDFDQATQMLLKDAQLMKAIEDNMNRIK